MFNSKTLLMILGVNICSILFFTPLVSGFFESEIKIPFPVSSKKTIVIDPGHGGRDHGAKAPDGSLEKDVTLRLSRLIAEQLDFKYKIILTRTDDYFLDPFSRTAIANKHDADLFISIHTGGSHVYQTSGLQVYYYQAKSTPFTSGIADAEKDEAAQASVLWDHVYKKYNPQNAQLVKTITKTIADMAGSSKTRINGAPILVLAGANMPAAMIEIGYLTNPSEGKNLLDSDFSRKTIKSITKAIKLFLDRRE